MARRKKKMIMTKELRTNIQNQREPAVWMNGKQVPGSVPFIRNLITTVSDPHDRDDLLGELAGEFLRAGMEDEHLLVQRERLANHPDEAVMWLGLAHSLSMRKDGAEEAKRAVAKGIEISRRVGTLIRYALTCQAEVARTVNAPTLFVQAIKELIADAPNYREEDCGLDDRILSDLPEGFCPADLEMQYLKLLEQANHEELRPPRPS
jgi:hypothetical protein